MRTRELSAEEGILLELDRFGALARQAGVTPGVIPTLFERWQHDGDDGPAFFKPVGRRRFTLGDAHATARTFLEESGRREQDASEAGRASVAGRVRRGRTGKNPK